MSQKTGLTLGLDCGGTNVKMAIVDDSGNLRHSTLQRISYDCAAETSIDAIATGAKKYLAEQKVQIDSLGVGIAGDVDPETGTVRFSPNLGWKNVAFGTLLRRHFTVPLHIDNDANCAAWGAYWLDAKRDCKNLICLTLGTGVGGGIIIDGKLYCGSTGAAGEIGHMTLQTDGRACKCGNFGCLESVVGAWGIIQSAEEALKKNRAPILKKMLEKKSELSPKLIAAAADAGDVECQELWKSTGEYLGCALVNLVNIFNPDRIVLSGGVSKSGNRLLDPALKILSQRAFQSSVKAVKVSISEFDEKLGVVGAALLGS